MISEVSSSAHISYLGSIHYLKKGDAVSIADKEFCVGIDTTNFVYIFLLNKSGKLISDNHLLYYGSKLRIGEFLKETEPIGGSNYHSISPDKAVIGPFEGEAHCLYHTYEMRRTYVNLDRLSSDVYSIVFCISSERSEERMSFYHARLFKNADWLFGGEPGDTIACTDFNEGLGCLVALKYPYQQIEEFQNYSNRDFLMATDFDFGEFGAAEILSINKVDEGWTVLAMNNLFDGINDIIEKYSSGCK